MSYQTKYHKKKILIILLLIFMSMIFTCNDFFVKSKAETTSEADTIPQIKGSIIYHSYSSYDAGDSKLYLYDFTLKKKRCISDEIKSISNAMNADFGNNANEIVFMAMPKGKKEWDIYQYQLDTGKLENLTKGNGLKDEDPKYSPDGQNVIFKQGHWDSNHKKMAYNIAELDLATKKVKLITNDEAEDSMPYYSFDGKTVYYARGVDNNSQIYKVELDNIRNPQKVYAKKNEGCYYPIVLNNFLYFSKLKSSKNSTDVVARYNLLTKKVIVAKFNGNLYNCSDPAPVSDDFIFMSCTNSKGKNGYDLYLANFTTGETWSLDKITDQINNKKEQLGCSSFIESISITRKN